MSVIGINGLRVNYSDVGSGAPIVFVPGLAGSGDWFHYQSAGLSDRYRVITYGLRPARGHINYSLDLLVDDLARFLIALKIYDAAVVGHSLGGLIAAQYAATQPDRCPALVLCSTSPAFAGLTSDQLISDMLPESFAAESQLARVWKSFFGSQRILGEESDPNQFLADAARQDSRTLNARLSMIQNADLTSVIDSVEAHTMVLVSSGDTPYIQAGSQMLQQSITGASLEVIEDVDRFYFYTRHDLFNAVLADYLNEKFELY